MKRILINAKQKEELRIALTNEGKLYNFSINNKKNKQEKSNIYKGKITRIEPSLEAAFVNYNSKKHGFLPLKEISKEYFPENILDKEKKNIKNILYEGQEIIVQINKEERDNKGASLTTFISLSGNHLVLMPNNSKSCGVSKKIEGEDRIELKSILSLLNLPIGMSVIIRTSGAGKSIKTLQLDLSIILKNWEKIKKNAKKNNAPYLIYQDKNIIEKTFRDYLYKDINEIIIDNKEIYKLAKNHVNKLGKIDFLKKIKFYNKKIPLFHYFKIENQIESAFKRKVRLPSGGSIIIDITEALISIDINSSKSTKYISIENTALNTNLEAIEEIYNQVCLRNLGGLIVIDFIDMYISENQKIIEKKIKNIFKKDKAKIKIGNISKFGLLEMSRQRLNPSLKELNYHKCPRCNGSGFIRDYKSLSLSILRIIEDESCKKETKEIHVIVPINIGTYLLNEKRNILYKIEKRKKKTKIIIIPNKKIKTPNYSIIRIKKNKKKNNIINIFKLEI